MLPAHDGHLDRLQRWLHRAVADISDPQQRRIEHRYADWHHLRRLRARTDWDALVTADQAATVRDNVGAAAAVLATLAASRRTLADLCQANVDQWLAAGQVARRAELGAFLRWACNDADIAYLTISRRQVILPPSLGRLIEDQIAATAPRHPLPDAFGSFCCPAGALVVPATLQGWRTPCASTALRSAPPATPP